jgi:hypothetical protein
MEDSVKDKTSVTVQFTASHNLSSTYITFGALAAPANKVVDHLDAAGTFEVKSANFDLPTVDYVQANIPHSIAELTAMNNALATALSGKALSFTAQIIA